MTEIRYISGPDVLTAWPDIRRHIEAACGGTLDASEIRRDIVFRAGGAVAWTVHEDGEHVATAVTQSRIVKGVANLVVLTIGGRGFKRWAPRLQELLEHYGRSQVYPALIAYVRPGLARWLMAMGWEARDASDESGRTRYMMERTLWATSSAAAKR